MREIAPEQRQNVINLYSQKMRDGRLQPLSISYIFPKHLIYVSDIYPEGVLMCYDIKFVDYNGTTRDRYVSVDGNNREYREKFRSSYIKLLEMFGVKDVVC